MKLVWTPELVQLLRAITPVLNCTMSQAKEFLKTFFAWVEARNETAYSIVASLMNKAGIKAHNDKVAAFLRMVKDSGFIGKSKNYGHFQDADGQLRRHGNFYVNSGKVVFQEQLGEVTNQQVVYNMYLLYLSFLSSDTYDYLLEYRRLILDESFGRRIRDLYGQGKKKNGVRMANKGGDVAHSAVRSCKNGY